MGGSLASSSSLSSAMRERDLDADVVNICLPHGGVSCEN